MKASEILRIAAYNLLSKKRRTFLTVSAIAIGVAAVVVLLSIGYGLERMVQRQTVGLDALKIVDVDAEKSSVIKLNSENVDKIKALPGVEDVVPQINSAGKIKFDGSVIDVTVFLVNRDYVEYSYNDTLWGETFAEGDESVILLNNVVANLLGLEGDAGIEGKQTDLEIILPASIASKDSTELRVNRTQLAIKGVVIDRKVEGSSTPIVYLPLEEIPELSGDVNYSKLKVLLQDAELLSSVRERIEGMGFTTASAADTVEQIESVFVTFRLILLVVGVVGITIAILGVFNTLTISLLERMREIGIMKALGMNSRDIQKLFFSESILISFLGGFLGVMGSSLVGELIELVFKLVARIRDKPQVEFYYTPVTMMFVVIVASLIMGLITGVYPAYKAKKTKALNALRYE